MEGNIVSPGFIDTQINGAYGFDFSVYEGDRDAYRRGLATIAEKIVETGVTSYVLVTFVRRTPLIMNYNSRSNPGLFLLSSYVLFPRCHHDCVDDPLRRRPWKNHFTQLCFRSFIPILTQGVQLCWDGMQRALSYK
jgi:hypothetical protein